MILIMEDDADREQYQRMYPFNPEFLNPDTMRPATVWISPEAYEEKIRADERERETKKNAPAVVHLLLAADEHRTRLADLRAKVEARERQAREMATHPDSYGTGPLWLARADAFADVLALLGDTDD
jgi:hypothetical protein